jgi:hypothetical protein
MCRIRPEIFQNFFNFVKGHTQYAFFSLQRQLMEQKQQKKRQARAGGIQTNDSSQYIYSRPSTAKSKSRDESKPLMELSSTSTASTLVTPLHGN